MRLRLVLPKDVPASDVMVKNPITVGSHEPVEQARRKIRIIHKGGVPVVDEGKLVGIITLVDMRKVSPSRTFSTEVKDVMTKNPVVGHSEDSLADLYEVMSRRAIGRIPIVGSDDSLLGLVSLSDLKDVSRFHAHNEIESGGGEVVKLVCPNCGHPLPIPLSRFVKCEYCETTSFLRV